jgi:diguanylate cyclase (GGDEF)-like protein
VLRLETRDGDFLCRYAGDEFILAVPGMERPTAAELARRLQTAVSGIELMAAERGKTVSLGISIGAAVFPDDGSDARALIALSDERMYADKAQRRVAQQATASVA